MNLYVFEDPTYCGTCFEELVSVCLFGNKLTFSPPELYAAYGVYFSAAREGDDEPMKPFTLGVTCSISLCVCVLRTYVRVPLICSFDYRRREGRGS